MTDLELLTTTSRQESSVSELDSESILGLLGIPILELSWEGKLIHANQGLKSLTGFSISEVNGRHIGSALLLEQDLRIVTDALVRVRDGECPVCFDTYVLTKHGDRRRVRWSATAKGNVSETADSVLLAATDITEEYDAKQELVQIRAQLRQARKEDSGRCIGREFSETGDLDRRRSSRHPYPYEQWDAPFRGDNTPSQAEFRQVQGINISSVGFSFVVPDPPPTQKVILRLGSGASHLDLIAKIVHVTPITYHGRPEHLIGCRYSHKMAD